MILFVFFTDEIHSSWRYITFIASIEILRDERTTAQFISLFEYMARVRAIQTADCNRLRVYSIRRNESRRELFANNLLSIKRILLSFYNMYIHNWFIVNVCSRNYISICIVY